MNKINKIFAGCLVVFGMAAALASCSKDNERIPDVASAKCPDGIALQIPAEFQKLIYKDATDADVLPLIVGQSVNLGYTLTPADATYNTVTWTTTDASVATIDNGKVTALSEKGLGYSVITVTPTGMFSGSGVFSSLIVKVADRLHQASAITLTADKTEVYEGEQVALKYEIEPEATTYRTLEWSSSDESVATVDSKGVVTGVSVGSTGTKKDVVITAKAMDGSDVSATMTITVKRMIAPESITLDQKWSVDNGYYCAVDDQTLTLTYTTVPADCTTSLLKWSSSDENIATVADGVVTFNKSGNFGDVTITATCPETNNQSSIRLHLAAGLVRELFHNENSFSWKDAGQSGNGTATSTEWHYGYVTVTTYTQTAGTKQRADFKHKDKIWLHAGNYPFFAVKMQDVKDTYKSEGVTARNINLDGSGGKAGEASFGGNVGGNNNKWKYDLKCSDGSHVFVYDLSTQGFATGGLLPTTEVTQFNTLQFKYADIATINHQITYNVYWVQTFKTLDDVKKYITDVDGLTFE